MRAVSAHIKTVAKERRQCVVRLEIDVDIGDVKGGMNMKYCTVLPWKDASDLFDRLGELAKAATDASRADDRGR